MFDCGRGSAHDPAGELIIIHCMSGICDIIMSPLSCDADCVTSADVSAQFRRSADDSRLLVSNVQSAAVESDADRSPFSCHAQCSHATIDLLLWKLTQLERRITGGQVSHVIAIAAQTHHFL